MAPARVVEAVDVFEHCDLDVPSRLPGVSPDQLGLERFEEALDLCPAGDLQSKSAERGPNYHSNFPCRSLKVAAYDAEVASGTRERSIGLRDRCGECSQVVGGAGRWPYPEPAMQDPVSCDF